MIHWLLGAWAAICFLPFLDLLLINIFNVGLTQDILVPAKWCVFITFMVLVLSRYFKGNFFSWFKSIFEKEDDDFLVIPTLEYTNTEPNLEFREKLHKFVFIKPNTKTDKAIKAHAKLLREVKAMSFEELQQLSSQKRSSPVPENWRDDAIIIDIIEIAALGIPEVDGEKCLLWMVLKPGFYHDDDK